MTHYLGCFGRLSVPGQIEVFGRRVNTLVQNQIYQIFSKKWCLAQLSLSLDLFTATPSYCKSEQAELITGTNLYTMYIIPGWWFGTCFIFP